MRLVDAEEVARWTSWPVTHSCTAASSVPLCPLGNGKLYVTGLYLFVLVFGFGGGARD